MKFRVPLAKELELIVTNKTGNQKPRRLYGVSPPMLNCLRHKSCSSDRSLNVLRMEREKTLSDNFHCVWSFFKATYRKERKKIEKFLYPSPFFYFLVMNDCEKLVTIQEIKLSFSKSLSNQSSKKGIGWNS